MHSMSKFLSRLLFVLALIFINGCASYGPPAPIEFNGPTTRLKETVMPYDSSKADFFILESIDDQRVENSARKTHMKNSGKGLNVMSPAMMEQVIPIKYASFKIRGRTEYSAPIQALTNPVYDVSGNISFTPEIDKVYVIKGDLGKNYSAVWIEEESTHKIIGEKIELKAAPGSTSANASLGASPSAEARDVEPFPDGPTKFVAVRTSPHQIVVDMPLDMRAEHASEAVAGSDWNGCKLDPVWGPSAPKAIQNRLLRELTSAKLFSQVQPGQQTTAEFRLKTEVHAFCGDTRRVGPFEYRGAGISSFLFSLERNGKLVWQGKIEKVIKDNDPEYSGTMFTRKITAITHVMSDSLRVVLKDLFAQLSSVAVD
jgi:hypothetical protein